MSNQTPHQKITPKQNKAPVGVMVGGIVVLGMIMLLIAAVAAVADDEPQANNVVPTFAPPPNIDGETLRQGMTLYTEASLPLAPAAGSDVETDGEMMTEACGSVEVQASPADGRYYYYFVDDSNVFDYWVYAVRTDDTGFNGWLPLAQMSTTLPEACD